MSRAPPTSTGDSRFAFFVGTEAARRQEVRIAFHDVSFAFTSSSSARHPSWTSASAAVAATGLPATRTLSTSRSIYTVRMPTLDLAVHERWMRLALAEGCRGLDAGAVPIGAVVVIGGEVVGRAFNPPNGSDSLPRLLTLDK